MASKANKMRLIFALGTALALSGLWPQVAHARYYGELEQPTKLVERGFYVGPDFGMLFLINNDTSAETLGFITGVSLGYDIFKYLSVMALADFAIFQAGPDIQGGISMFLLNGGVKATYPVWPKLWPYARFLAGAFFTDPNLKDSTSGLFNGVPTKTFDMWIGGGILYYMAKRHFSLELGGDYVYIADFPFDAINLSLSLRYTF